MFKGLISIIAVTAGLMVACGGAPTSTEETGAEAPAAAATADKAVEAAPGKETPREELLTCNPKLGEHVCVACGTRYCSTEDCPVCEKVGKICECF